MRFPLIIFGLCTLFLVSVTATEEQSTSLWDMIPGIAQGKSLVQLIFGDKDGAVKTQEHFLNEGLGSSQLRSIYFLVTGEPKKALDIQGKFFSNLEGVVDGIPIVGHVKGGIHLLAGDHEHGWGALKTATSTTGSIVGGFLGGPAGAIGGHFLTDVIISGADVVLNGNQSQPYGLVQYLTNINKLKPGEHFDQIAGLLLDAKAAKKVMTERGRLSHEELPVESHELQSMLEKEKIDNQRNVETPNKLDIVSEETVPKSNRPSPSQIMLYSSQPKEFDYEKSNSLKFKAFNNFLQQDPTYKDFHLHMVWSDGAKNDSLVTIDFDGLDNFQYNYNLESLNVDLLKNKLSYLTDDEKSLINNHDFRTINTEVTKPNCLSCSFAEIVKKNLETVRKYIKENLHIFDPVDKFDVDLCLESLKNRSFIKYTTSNRLNNIRDLNMYLKSNAWKLENKYIILEEMVKEGNNTSLSSLNGHSVVMKFKMVKGNPDPVKLIFDYQYPGFIQLDLPNPYRFQPFIDTNNYDHFYVNNIEILE